MNPLEALQNALQYPQSVLTGLTAFGGGMHGQGFKSSGDFDASIGRGLRGGFSPSDLATENETQRAPWEGLTNVLTDIAYDPVNLAGGTGASSKLIAQGGKAAEAGKLLEGASTFGKMGADASKAQRAAQAARYLYQGAIAGGGDPGIMLATAASMPVAERALGRVAGRFLTKAGTEIADDVTGDAAEKILSQTGVDQIESEYTQALRALGMPVEGDGFSMRALTDAEQAIPDSQALVPWKPTPDTPGVDIADPMVQRARDYLRMNPEATTVDLLYDFPDLRRANAGDVMAQARQGLMDTTRVPYSERGALFNQRLLEDGMPSMVRPGELTAQSVERGIPPGQAVERFDQFELMDYTPELDLGQLPNTFEITPEYAQLLSGPGPQARGQELQLYKPSVPFAGDSPEAYEELLQALQRRLVPAGQINMAPPGMLNQPEPAPREQDLLFDLLIKAARG